MSSLSVALIILTVLCYNSQVHSKDPTILSKSYKFSKKQLVLGKPYFDNPTLIYALCDENHEQPTKKCSINFEIDVFDDTKKVKTCNITLKSILPKGMLDPLEVTFWGKNKGIFLSREVTLRDLEHAWVLIQIIDLQGCQVLTTQQLVVNARDEEKPEIFFIRSQKSFDIIFYNKDDCHNHFCKINVNESGAASYPVPWLPSNGLLYGVEPIEHISTVQQLVIIVRDIENKIVNFILKSETESIELDPHKNINSLAWSTSHGIISICSCDMCTRINQNGKVDNIVKLKGMYKICEISTLYNLPSGEQLMMVADKSSTNGHYRIIKIGTTGELGKSLALNEILNSLIPGSLSSTFFQDIDMKYCLALFHPIIFSSSSISSYNTESANVKFSKYCFSPEDLS